MHSASAGAQTTALTSIKNSCRASADRGLPPCPRKPLSVLAHHCVNMVGVQTVTATTDLSNTETGLCQRRTNRLTCSASARAKASAASCTEYPTWSPVGWKNSADPYIAGPESWSIDLHQFTVNHYQCCDSGLDSTGLSRTSAGFPYAAL